MEVVPCAESSWWEEPQGLPWLLHLNLERQSLGSSDTDGEDSRGGECLEPYIQVVGQYPGRAGPTEGLFQGTAYMCSHVQPLRPSLPPQPPPPHSTGTRTPNSLFCHLVEDHAVEVALVLPFAHGKPQALLQRHGGPPLGQGPQHGAGIKSLESVKMHKPTLPPELRGLTTVLWSSLPSVPVVSSSSVGSPAS